MAKLKMPSDREIASLAPRHVNAPPMRVKPRPGYGIEDLMTRKVLLEALKRNRAARKGEP